MKIGLSTNAEQVFADMDAFAGALEQTVAPRVVAKLADQAKVVAVRVGAETYGLKRKDIEPFVIVVQRRTEGAVALVVRGSRLPMYLFNAKQTPEGVRVRVKRRTILIRGAFIATVGAGHTGVFARGAYGGKGLRIATGNFGRFQFGRGRYKTRGTRKSATELPINELYTFGLADVFGSQEVFDAMIARLEEQTPKVVAQEIRFANLQLRRAA